MPNHKHKTPVNPIDISNDTDAMSNVLLTILENTSRSPLNVFMIATTNAIKKNPKVIWLQEGIHNEEAENLAREHGIDVVFNRCMLAEHQRLM